MTTSAASSSIRLDIPHPEIGGSIAGILECRSPESPASEGRPIALILHGTMGHKDYLYQKRLAQQLPIDSYRFDFRGAHETPGTWRLGGFVDDVADIRVVVSYLTRELGYKIALIVGHSRGSVAGLTWMCTSEEGSSVLGYVNCSGRYRMEKVYDDLPRYQTAFDDRGFYEWKLTVARKPVTGVIRPGDIEEFAHWNTAIVRDRFPSQTHVLTVHGMADGQVPTYDGVIYARIFGARSPGTHNLHLIEGADHNFTGRADEVNDVIMSWWQALARNELKTGVWGDVPKRDSKL